MFMVFLLWAEVEAQRCAATLPVGETWGSKGKGGWTWRGITRLTRARDYARVCTRLMTASSVKILL
ncbi:hypothetical protein [Bradyrhizobium sp. sBnM-33]|uniref:hypothetical protein n=1 Tax=Bradyrhizobium sp. sBnM-33 TaxID=2831780 RepID=UPI001BCD62F2|nr:hypothetical protein [Bradyrhizobium sp. sBnM-33]WOH53235.1 hypothetical protein RX328_14765 [Bradyrhizobium sp. sBnM-33]